MTVCSNASIQIFNYILNLKGRGLFDVGIIFGGKIKPFSSSLISLNEIFSLSIGGAGGYKITVPASKFKVTKILKKKIYTYIARDIKIVLLNSGEFEILIDKSNLQGITQQKVGDILIDVDTIAANATIELKCIKNICKYREVEEK